MEPEATRRCLGCGYDLRGLPRNRCPECGRGFDPGDPATYAPAGARSGRPFLWLAVLSVMLTAVTFMVMDDLAIRWRGQPAWVGWVWLSLIGAGLVLAVYVFQGAGRALNRGRTAVRNRGQMIAGLVIAGFVLLGFARLALQMVGCR